MRYVLITVKTGAINNAQFYDDIKVAIKALAEFIKSMDYKTDDAALYSSTDGLIANKKAFLDEENKYVEKLENIMSLWNIKKEQLFIIGNPESYLGFMVIADSDEPIGYIESCKALYALEEARKKHGMHIKLYELELVNRPIIERAKMEEFNAMAGVEDFHYPLIMEYLK